MDLLIKFIKENAHTVLSAPALISFLMFMSQLALDLKDGHLDDNEFHALFASASGIETLILFAVMAILRKK